MDGAPAAFSLATLEAVGFVAAVPAPARVALAFVTGGALVAAVARVPRLGFTTVVPLETADESDVLEFWLALR